MQFDKVFSALLERMEGSLPANLLYHSVQHTRSVISAAIELAAPADLNEDELILLKTAALFHDSGFLETYQEHEEASCVIAKRELPKYDYSSEQINEVCSMIAATKLPQAPQDKLAEILCDADLAYLGTDLYFPVANLLHTELLESGIKLSDKQWRDKQIGFLESHHYFTPVAKSRFDKKKEENLQKLKKGDDLNTRGKRKGGIQDALLIICGVVTAGFALKGFLVPNNFFDGGVTGISLLIHELYHLNLAYVILIANLPLIIVSYFNVNKAFAVKTFVAVFLLGVCLQFMSYPVITSDKLLISIFGGFFLGVGIGLTIRAGCALDGIEVLALYTLKRSSFTITEIILALNVIIFVIAAFKFGLETSLYSILTYFTASRTIDFVIEGIEAYTGVTIISGESEKIKYRLVNELGRGITVYKGERGFLPGTFEVKNDVDIIFTVITRLELRRLKNLVYDSDPKAFVFANTIREASGGIIKRRRRGH